MLTVRRTDVPISVWQAMNGDVATRRNPEPSGPLAVHRIRIGNVERSMTRAPRIPAVDDVCALGGAQVPLLLLCPRLTPQRNLVSLQHVPVVHEFQGVFFLVHDDAIGVRESVNGGRGRKQTGDERCEYPKYCRSREPSRRGTKQPEASP